MTQLPAHRDETDLTRVPEVPVQRVQTNYTTAVAVQRPRQLPVIEQRAMQEAAMIGADGYYGWGKGKNRVEGPTVGLAMAMARCWGNCALDLGEVQDLPDSWIFSATFVDLETGFTLTRQFRQSKTWTVFGDFGEDRKMDIRFQIGQSKAVRNVVLNAVPSWLINRALDKCKGGVREALEKYISKVGMPETQKGAMSKLAAVGATPDRVLFAMGRKAVAALTIEDLVILKGDLVAIESGADTLDAVFPIPSLALDSSNDGKSKSQKLSEKLGAGKAAATTPPTAGQNSHAPTSESQRGTDPVAEAASNPQEAAPETPKSTEPPEPPEPPEAPANTGPSVDGLVDLLVAKYDGDPEAARTRLDSFCQSLFKKTLADCSVSALRAVEQKIQDGSITL